MLWQSEETKIFPFLPKKPGDSDSWLWFLVEVVHLWDQGFYTWKAHHYSQRKHNWWAETTVFFSMIPDPCIFLPRDSAIYTSLWLKVKTVSWENSSHLWDTSPQSWHSNCAFTKPFHHSTCPVTCGSIPWKWPYFYTSFATRWIPWWHYVICDLSSSYSGAGLGLVRVPTPHPPIEEIEDYKKRILFPLIIIWIEIVVLFL